MTGPSAHLSWEELRCKDGTDYPQRFIDDGRAEKLGRLFEKVRALCGDAPMTVTSGYRSPAHNARIGGVPTSQHKEGRALDLKHARLTPEEVYTRVREAARAGQLPELGGLGRYASFTHIDTRPGRLVVWNGRAQVKDDR